MSLDCTGILCDEHVPLFQHKPISQKTVILSWLFFLLFKAFVERFKEKTIFLMHTKPP